MLYNVLLMINNGRASYINLLPKHLERIVHAYQYGTGKYYIDGNTVTFPKIRSIKIYESSIPKESTEKFLAYAKEHYYARMFSEYIPEMHLKKHGINITESMIEGSYGYLQIPTKLKVSNNDVFVDEERINALRKLKSDSFDLTKLVRLCEEINIALQNNLYYSIAMLLRSLIDHIPPIFEKSNFTEVVNNYGSRSFKQSMKNLNNSLRKISDNHLHSHIRRKETNPTRVQINFSSDLDVLLGEIIAQLK